MFESRFQAGELLANKLKQKGYEGQNTLVLAIPRGGVPVGVVLARVLKTSLDVIVTRKIPSPSQPELALGAVGPQGSRVVDVSLVDRLGIKEEYLKQKIDELEKEVEERLVKFRLLGKEYDIEGQTIILVDDGMATGATIEVAVRFLKTKSPQKIVIAVPVASRDSIDVFRDLVDDIVVLEIPENFEAVGQFYREFPQVSDEEVMEMLEVN